MNDLEKDGSFICEMENEASSISLNTEYINNNHLERNSSDNEESQDLLKPNDKDSCDNKKDDKHDVDEENGYVGKGDGCDSSSKKVNDSSSSLEMVHENLTKTLDSHILNEKEEDLANQEMDEEIDDALDEGYMGMECTLERGFSLNESALEKAFRADLYDEMTVDYIHKSFPHKYSSAIKHFIPIRKPCKDKDKIKLDSAGLFSFITFSWMSKLMWKAYKKGLQEDDIPLCSKHEMCNSNIQRLNEFWKEEVEKKGLENATLYHPVWRFLRTRIIVALIILGCSLISGFIGPTIFMRYLIAWLSTDEPIENGVVWAIGLVCCEALRVVSFSALFAMNYRTATRLRAACLGLVYKKLMCMSNLGHKSIGEIVNLFANDGQRIHDFIVLGTFFIGGFIIAIAAVGYILCLLGPWALLGMASFLFFYPFQYLISRLSGYLRRKTITVTDERVSMMNEIFNCVKLIKMYSWEKSFRQTVMDIRKRERKFLEKSAYVNSLSLAMTPVVPVVAAIITFLAHVGAGNNLNAAQAFSIVAVLLGNIRMSLNMLRYSVFSIVEFRETLRRLQAFSLIGLMTRVRGQLHYVPYCLLSYREYLVALGRIKSILSMKEMENYVERHYDGDSIILLRDASFAWSVATFPKSKKQKKNSKKQNLVEEEEEAELKLKIKLLDEKKENSPFVEVLHKINLEIQKGELIGVCGGVGVGKSSLLQGVLGQMLLRQGSVTVGEDCAYVGQESWILNATFRDNILFGEPFDAKRYYKVMYACSLTEDVAHLPGGDYTEIGERGINLSGGQKQRVSLARALYSNKNIYLLDDCLSAVDAHVGQHIFQWVFRNALKNKTVIFVTHQLQYLPDCDRVMLLRDGQIEEIGRHIELIKKGGSYSSLFKKHLQTLNKENSKSKQSMQNNSYANKVTSSNISDHSSKKDIPQNGNLKSGQLTTKEEIETGDIPRYVYQKYIKFCGGYVVVFAVVLTFLLSAASIGFGSWWLSVWIGAGSGNTTIVIGNETIVSDNIGDNPDINYYRTIYGLSIVFILVTALVRGFAIMKATIHGSSRMHNAVFEKIFRAPMLFFDTTPSGRILNIFSRDMDEVDVRLPSTMEMLLQNIWLILISLMFVALVFPYFIIFLVFIAGFFLFVRHIFKIGVRELKRFENTSRSPIFTHISTTVNGLSSIQAYQKQNMFMKRFMKLFDENSCHFDLFNSGCRWLAIRLDFVALSVILVTSFLCVCLRGSVGPASAGLALAYASQLSGIFQHTVRLSTEAEARFTSVQRIISYLKTVASEGLLTVKGNKPNNNWPKFGRICFKKVELKYREETALALKGVSFDIDSQEKIGVIGRTGSGKSSLGTALFRLVELKRGSITIDGINISSIGLEDLRSRLSIIPQDPVLFIGTIRYNLDPFNRHSDTEIWNALEKTRIKDTISALDLKLAAPVTENGGNFSVGERQLICMARALLRNNKILFLDEATAGIDTETDLKIQETLKEAFKNCTLITVAHRLNTIMSCSRVIVMDNGNVVEFDSPEELLKSPASRFSKLVAASKHGLHFI